MIGDNTTVSQWVTNVVVVAGWVWVFMLLFAIPVGIYVVLYNMWQSGTVPDLGAFATAVNPGFLILGGAFALIGFVLVLANTTFGRSNVEAAIKQTEELQEETQNE